MVSKGILAAAVIVVILIVGGSMYMMQQPPSTQVSTPTTPKPAATTPAETPTIPEAKTLTSEEETEIKDAVMNYINTFNQHSVEEHLVCFTDDGLKMLGSVHGTEEYYGHDKIRYQLIGVFEKNPDISLENVMSEIQGVREDKVIVQCAYRIISEKSSYNIGVFEEITLVKIGNTWKIAKSDTSLVSNDPLLR